MKCLLNKPKYAGIGLAMLVLIISLSLVRGPNVSANSAATVPVGSGPMGVAVNEATNTIYVVNNVSDTVSVIDGNTNTVTTVPVGSGPSGVAVNANTNTIYVANSGNNTVSVIDGTTNTVTDTVPVGNKPQGVAVNATTNTIYVANGGYGVDTVSVIDGNNSNTVTNVSVSGIASGVAVDAANNKIYVAISSGNRVSVINGNSGTYTGDVSVGSSPQGVAVDATTNKIYVANDDGVSVIDGTNNAVTSISIAGSSPQGVAVNATTNKIYVANGSGNTISVIDGTSNTVTETLNVGNSPQGVAVNEATNTIYVANSADGTISVIDGARNYKVAATVPVGSGPYGVAVDETTNKIYVANNNDGTVSVIDGASNTVTATVDVGISTYSSPYGVAVDAANNKIYVANNGDDTVSVIDVTNSSVANVSVANGVGAGPSSVAANAETNKIYVVNNGVNNVSVIDGSSIPPAVTATVNVGSLPQGVAVDKTTNTIYAANSGGTVSVIDGSSIPPAVTATVNVGSLPQGVAVDETTNRIYVANSGSKTVSVIDGNNSNTVTTVNVGSSPTGVAVNAATNTIYVVNSGDNTVSIIDGNSNKVTETLNVGSDPVGVAVNTATNEIYVTNNLGNTVSVISAGLTNVTDSISPGGYDIAGASATHTIAFTATDAIPSDGKIKIDFPSASGFDLSGVNKVTITGLDGNFALTNTSAESLTIIRSGGNSSATGVAVSIPLDNVINGNAGSNYTANVTTLDSSNNTIDSGTSSSFTINKADTTTAVTTSGSPSVYGSPVTFTATVSVNSPGSGTPTGTVTFYDGATTLGTGTLDGGNPDTATFITSTTQLAAGNYTHINAVYGGDSNYNGSTSSDITQIVNPRPVTLTGSRYYDGTNSADHSILNITNNLDGGNLTLGGSATLASANAPSEAITDFSGLTLGGSASSNYTLTEATGSVNITALPITLSGSRYYDGTSTADHSILNITNNLDGGNLTLGGSATLASANAPSETITGFSGLTLGGSAAGNYTLTGASGSVTINKITPSWSNLSHPTITYGTTQTSIGGTISSGSLFPSGNVSITVNGINQTAAINATTGAFSYDFATNSVVPSGSPYTITYHYAGDTNFNSPSDDTSNTLTVNQLAVTLSGTRNYDGTTAANYSILSITNKVGSDDVTLASGSATLAAANAGPEDITDFTGLTLGGMTKNNYTISGATGSVTINKKDLTVTATGPSKVYGEALTTGTSTSNFTSSGEVNGESVTSVTLTPDSNGASATTAAGSSYTVTPSLATGTGGFSASNYNITYNAYSGTVSAAPLTVTATGPSKVYGEALTAGTSTTNFTSSGEVNGESVTSVTLTPDAAGLSATTAIGSAYTITPSAATGTGGFSESNYNVTYIAYNGTVSKASTTIALITSNGNTQYGQEVTFTATVAATASGIGTPTGSVTFMDGTTTLGSETLDSSGQATYSTSNLITGIHSITAVYSGDDNFSDSTSPAVSQTIYSNSGTSPVNSAPVIPVTSNNGTLNLTNVVDSAGIFEVPAAVTSADNNATVTIDASVVGQTSTGAPLTQITIAPVSNPPAPPPQANAVALNYDLGPSGAKFSSPITITLTYDPSKVPSGETPYIAWYNTQTGQWEQLTTVSVNPNANPPTISATVNHFTTFSVFAAAQASPTPTPTATPTPTSSPAPTASVTPTASPTPTVAPTSPAPTTPVVPPSSTPAQSTSPTNWGLIIGIIVVCLVIIFVVVFVLTRRKKPTSG